MKKYLIEILKALRQLFVRRSVCWKDVCYHTGFYRFDEKYQKMFKKENQDDEDKSE